MTEHQPPQDRPEFEPPGGSAAGQPVPAAQPPPYQPPVSPEQPPPPYQPPASPEQPPPPPYQPAPSQAYQPPTQPYPPPAQAGTYPPFQQPAPQPKTGRGSIWLGIGITVAALLASWGLAVAVPYDSPLASTMNLLAAGLPFALVLGGIVMAAIPRTTRTGAGVLIGIGAGILIAGGLCFALVLGFGAFGG